MKRILMLLILSVSVWGQSAPVPPPGMPAERFKQLQEATSGAAKIVPVQRPTAYGIPPDRYEEMQAALQEAYLSDGEIREVTDKIEALMAYRDKLVAAAAKQAHPELKEEIDLFRKGQAKTKEMETRARHVRGNELRNGKK